MSVDSINQTSSPAYGPIQTRKASATHQDMRSNANDDQKTSSTPKAVTGTTGSRLSVETTAKLIAVAQEPHASNTDTPLPIGIQHGLDDIANNPEYAAKRAQELAESSDLVHFSAEEFPKNGTSAAVWNAFRDKMEARMEVSKQVGQQRNSYYQSLKAEDLPPAQLYAKLVEFNANLPESYNDTVGFSNSGMNMTWSQYHAASHDYLQQAITPALKS